MLVLALVGAMLGSAWADVTVTALGSAQTAGVRAGDLRALALADAHRQAVDQAARQLATPQELARASAVMQNDVLPRARDFVVAFRVLDERESDGVYTVRISAEVATRPLAKLLQASGVSLTGHTDVPAASGRPSVAMLLVSTDGHGQWASFGADARKGPAEQALAEELLQAGFAVPDASGVRVPTEVVLEGTPSAPGVTDAQARAMADELGSGVAVVGTVRSTDGGPVRGTSLVGAETAAELRAVGDELRWQGGCQRASFGETLLAAMEDASRQAARCAARELSSKLAARWPVAESSTASVLVRLRTPPSWEAVAAVQRAIEELRGVGEVTVRRLSRAEVLLGVTGNAAPRAVASVISRLSWSDGTPAIAVTGTTVDVSLGAP